MDLAKIEAGLYYISTRTSAAVVLVANSFWALEMLRQILHDKPDRPYLTPMKAASSIFFNEMAINIILLEIAPCCFGLYGIYTKKKFFLRKYVVYSGFAIIRWLLVFFSLTYEITFTLDEPSINFLNVACNALYGPSEPTPYACQMNTACIVAIKFCFEIVVYYYYLNLEEKKEMQARYISAVMHSVPSSITQPGIKFSGTSSKDPEMLI